MTHSWYKYGDEAKGLHPFDGVTDPNFVLGKDTKGTRTNIENIDESAKYSWVKSPRWKGNAVEVGPLARYIVAYARGNEGHQGAGRRRAEGARRARSPRCSRRSAAPPPAGSNASGRRTR